MSSLRNAAKRRQHKERAQPAARRKTGLLEKHADYVLRAQDFHRKEATIKQLRHKADQRNPDEFFYGMDQARTAGGVHVKRSTEANKYSHDELRLMKTQDVKYLALKAQEEAKKVGRMQEALHLLSAPATQQHVVFVEQCEEAEQFEPARHFDTAPQLVDRSYNRPRLDQLARRAVSNPQVAGMEKQQLGAYQQLSQRQQRQRKLGTLAQQLAHNQEAMSKGRKRKLPQGTDGGQRPTYCWKSERRR